jgi:hypothetical protein
MTIYDNLVIQCLFYDLIRTMTIYDTYD